VKTWAGLSAVCFLLLLALALCELAGSVLAESSAVLRVSTISQGPPASLLVTYGVAPSVATHASGRGY
jgi:hypothetical protein